MILVNHGNNLCQKEKPKWGTLGMIESFCWGTVESLLIDFLKILVCGHPVVTIDSPHPTGHHWRVGDTWGCWTWNPPLLWDMILHGVFQPFADLAGLVQWVASVASKMLNWDITQFMSPPLPFCTSKKYQRIAMFPVSSGLLCIYIYISHIYLYHIHIYIYITCIYISVTYIYIYTPHIYTYMYHIYIYTISHMYIYIYITYIYISHIHISHIYIHITYIYIHITYIYMYIYISHTYIYISYISHIYIYHIYM